MSVSSYIITNTGWIYTYDGRFPEVKCRNHSRSVTFPRIDDLIDQVGKAKCLTKLDATKGYWTLPMDEESIPYSAFITPHGHFGWRYMAFCLRNSPSTYKIMMHTLLKGCATFVKSYLDDIVIFSESWEDHLKHIEIVFKRVRDAQLKLNKKKYTFKSATFVLDIKIVSIKLNLARSRLRQYCIF